MWGASVALVDVSQDALDEQKRTLASDNVTIIQADVLDEADVERYVSEAEKALGGVDAFFNNAGIEGKVANLVDMNVDDFDKVIAVNLRGAFLGLKHVLPRMTSRKFSSQAVPR